MCRFHVATIITYFKFGDNTNFSLMVLEVKSLKSKCEQDWFLLEAEGLSLVTLSF